MLGITVVPPPKSPESEPVLLEISGRSLKALSDSTVVPTSTEMFPLPSVSVPAGITKPFDCKAVTMFCCVSPLAVRTLCLSSRFTRFSVMPLTATSRTPGTPERIGVATSAKILPSASLSSEATPRAMIGTLSNEPDRICASASSGSTPLRVASAAFRSSVTAADLVP